MRIFFFVRIFLLFFWCRHEVATMVLTVFCCSMVCWAMLSCSSIARRSICHVCGQHHPDQLDTMGEMWSDTGLSVKCNNKRRRDHRQTHQQRVRQLVSLRLGPSRHLGHLDGLCALTCPEPPFGFLFALNCLLQAHLVPRRFLHNPNQEHKKVGAPPQKEGAPAPQKKTIRNRRVF